MSELQAAQARLAKRRADMAARESDPVAAGPMAAGIGAILEGALRRAGLVGRRPVDPTVELRAEAEAEDRQRRRAAELAAYGCDAKHAKIIAAGVRSDGPYAEAGATMREALAWCERDDARFLVLHGPAGRGKSLVANACVERLTRPGAGGYRRRAAVVSASLFLRDVWYQRPPRRDEPPTPLPWTRADVLRGGVWVIDDVGHEGDDARGTAEALAAIVGHFARLAEARLIITTNLDASRVGPGTLAGWLGHRAAMVITRVSEYGRLLPMNGPNLRPFATGEG